MSLLGQVGKVAGVVVGAAGLAGVGALAALRQSQPRTSGRVTLKGACAPVEVIRDRWGVPHIYAASSDDLFLAQGYIHAQDRLWQMEFNRRLGHGRLSELVGAVALDTDRFVRILGFSRIARREVALLDDAAFAACMAYVRGVNAFLETERLPVEFTLLRHHPEPWRVEDILVWSKMMALNLSRNWTSELVRARIVAAVGAQRAAELEPLYPADQPLTIPTGTRYSADIGATALDGAAALHRYLGRPNGQGSNAWAVAGTRTASGKPLLADDPHLAISIPSTWYENHLVGGAYEVTGASFPGSPGVVIGHNARIAWGVTNVEADVQDLYIERFDQADPLRYEFRGQSLTAELVHEEIRVKDQPAPIVEAIRITHHGPIVSAFAPAPSSEELALRWTALEPGRVVNALLGINRAADWDAFRAALVDWNVPPQNFVYADIDGHIGYTIGGALPIRANSDGRLPVPGWSGDYEWTGFIPAAELPHAYDPPEGMVVTANNQVAGDDYPYPLAAEWLNGYRAARINDMLGQTLHHDAASFARIHRDTRSLPGLELAALAGRFPAGDDVARAARDELANWTGELTTTSVAGLIYARYCDQLLDAAYSEVAGPLGLTAGLGAFASLLSDGYLNRALPQVLRRAAARDDAWLPPGRTWDTLLADVWAATLAELRAEFGDNVAQWRYGRAHAPTFRHALGGVAGLGRLLNRGPLQLGGDADTVCQGGMPRRFAALPFYIGPSYRQICDAADWNRSWSIHAIGQSGHPADRHYADFIEPWSRGRYHPMLWNRSHIEEVAEARLVLTPDH